mmetsp:Transcript_31396/g.35606  ORF Transcript_31396/g.35606 Transcript_31396/m.35606 type:complete len:90 (+) Transcript_31396:178-447(+)
MFRHGLAVIIMHVPNRGHHTILQVKVIVTMKEMLSGIEGIKIKNESLVIGYPDRIHPGTCGVEVLSAPLDGESSVVSVELRSVRLRDVI